MIRKKVSMQQASKVVGRKGIEIPKPLEQLTEKELERKRCISRVLTYVLEYFTCKFVNCGFEWMQPVILSKSTDPLLPDPGASLEKRIEVAIYGKIVRPTLSMIVHKMVACSLVQPNLFILSPNIRIERIERANSGIHAYEFTQLDFEVRDADSQEIRSLVEKIICGLISSLKKHMKEELTYLRSSSSLRNLELPFRVYDRQELESEYGENWETQMMPEIYNPIWITNIPREFYDFEDSNGKWDNYDLLLPMYGEVLSGGRREWKYEKLARKMERDKVKKEDYEVLLKLAKEGRIKPSAGAGIGIERLVSWIVRAGHIGETQMFPKIPGIIYDL